MQASPHFPYKVCTTRFAFNYIPCHTIYLEWKSLQQHWRVAKSPILLSAVLFSSHPPRHGLAVLTHGNQKDPCLSKLYIVGFAIIF
jgi:hypothetical protein